MWSILHTYKKRLITRQYYESMGSRHYGLAASHNTARKEDFDAILTTLSSRFLNVRRALTRLSVDYLVFNRSKAVQTYLSIMNERDGGSQGVRCRRIQRIDETA